ncbi:hypothetical protein [Paucibacter sp. KCTC 42545]|uniref:hypothetical protein n=1 Tax=Paucibacter sp. KCTC 42545 TaxID=1768242 RepID=UPI000733C3FB|nr:hypothetical protein [Paucibacter sp. KCTC 42545]ALT79029.1 hypothetical protein AT984_19400 [Paucibacter sp. KCTC 42545]
MFKKIAASSVGARRRQWLALAAGLLVAGQASAAGEAAARKYVAVSLLGDTVHVVTRQDQTGSRLDANLRESFEFNGGVFDQAALAALDAAVRKADTSAQFFGLKLPSAKVFGDPQALIDGERFVTPAALAPVFKQIQATHLLLITSYRTDNKIKSLDDNVGRGYLEGQGFYIGDRMVKAAAENERYKGFLAPYTYFKISLIDVASGKVEGRSMVTRGEALISKRKEAAANPWEYLTTEQKVETLRTQIREEVTDAVPALLKPLRVQ